MADRRDRNPRLIRPAANPTYWIVLAFGALAFIGLVTWGFDGKHVPQTTASHVPDTQAPVPATR